jgi:hypothetical protein
MIVLDPVQQSSADEIPHAPRLDTLDGRTVGLWNNGKLNAAKLLELMREQLEQHYSFDVKRGLYDPAASCPTTDGGRSTGATSSFSPMVIAAPAAHRVS